MKTNVLVTGGAGFIGSQLTDRLIEENYEVLVIDDLSNGKLNNVNKKAQFVKVNITSQKFAQIFKKLKPKIVFHLAAQSSINKSLKNPSQDIKINLVATQTLLEIAKSTNVNKIIFTSSAAVYKPSNLLPIKEDAPKQPISLYGVSKLCSEYLIRNFYNIYHLPFITLRLANVYGPRQDSSAEGGVVSIFIKNILNGNSPKIHGDGNQKRDFIYISDVLEVFANSLKKNITGEFNVGKAQETSINGLFNMVSRIANIKLDKKYINLSYPEVQRSSLSYEKLRVSSGWTPKVSLEDGLNKTYKYFKNLYSLGEHRGL